jgi:hypothetical protein
LASPPTFDNRDLIVALAARLSYAAETPGFAAPVGKELDSFRGGGALASRD